MKKITKLTKKQEMAMSAYAQKWIDIGLKTGETDWATFDKYMHICYEKTGLKYPTRIVHVPSPFFGAHVASLAHEIWNKRYTSMRDSVEASVGASVEASVRDSVRDSVERRNYEESIVKEIGELAIKYGVKTSWNYWLGGQFWVGGWYYWGVAFVNFFFDVCGLKISEDIMKRAEAYRKVCESVNYIWLNRDFILVCERPVHILRNEQGRLHSMTQKAIMYPDGWGLYMIHGVKFTEEQFKKARTASITDIIGWTDIDQRSVLLRERPIKELLETVPKKLIDHTDELGGYDLWEIEFKDIGKTKVLTYKGWSSEKEYIKFCPSDSLNALITVAKLRHQTVEELRLSIRS